MGKLRKQLKFDSEKQNWRMLTSGNDSFECFFAQTQLLSRMEKNSHNVRLCGIDTCPNKSEKCDHYTSLVYSKSYKVYKNIECAKCNGETEGLSCIPFPSEIKELERLSFKTLLYFRVQQICSDDEIYDPFIDRCFNLQCHTWKNGCIARNLFPISSFVSKPQSLITMVCLLASILCLSLHLFVYSMISELRTVPGKMLMSLSSSLLAAHLTFLTTAFVKLRVKSIECTIIGILMHYLYLCSFSWMNVIAFDVWKGFGLKLNIANNSMLRFKRYAVYAWLIPAVIVSSAIVNEFCFPSNSLQPLYGTSNCWISQQNALLAFFAAPLFVTLFANVSMFCFTVRGLIKVEKITAILRKKEKISIVFYLKIAVIMGFTWIFGLLASFIDSDTLWYLFIILNGSQGVFIFIAFTLKRANVDLIRTRFTKG
ncbi:hypothetical protein B4U79_04480 [Dinothrombium tinctorium]|uniref:G-protein coupled receptors family 2 profile 2 domain-containing protein n=1 Tax=Dinothrombium tinctorium TaxID=1965070 RepID=A0A443QRF5_9ACAR|nr:hypothetical protein B4U79_04480 [Dinothrombium tinctorium]